MTRSEFDPTNPEAASNLRSGARGFLGAEAKEASKMPPDMVDGEVEEDAPEDNEMSHEALSADEAARRLTEMSAPQEETTEEEMIEEEPASDDEESAAP